MFAKSFRRSTEPITARRLPVAEPVTVLHTLVYYVYMYNKSVFCNKSLLINIFLCKAREGKACPTTVLQMLTCRLALIDSA